MYHEMPATINKRPVPHLEMLGTYHVGGIHETVKCHIHDLEQVWLE